MRDYGDVHYNINNMNDVKNMSHLDHVASCMSNLSEQIRQVLRDGRQALIIGGDHSLSIGTIDGHVKVQKRNIFIEKLIIFITFKYYIFFIGKTRCGSNMGRCSCRFKY